MSNAAAAVNRALKAHGLPHTAAMVRAEDPQTEDDEIEIRLAGQPTRFAIQLCEVGGGFAVNEYTFDENGELDGVVDRGHCRALAQATAKLCLLLKGKAE